MGRTKRRLSPEGAGDGKRRKADEVQDPEQPLQAALDYCALGVSETALAILVAMRVPTEFFGILLLMRSSVSFRDIKDLDCVEFFAGVQAITTAARDIGMASCAFDIDLRPIWNDLCGPEGFLTAMQWCRRTKISTGCTWWATVCSTWIWMCRASTGRREWKPSGEHMSAQ